MVSAICTEAGGRLDVAEFRRVNSEGKLLGRACALETSVRLRVRLIASVVAGRLDEHGGVNFLGTNIERERERTLLV